MKTFKKLLLPLLLIPFLLTGCGTQGPVGPMGPQGSQGIPGEKGDKGEKGVSITKVEKTSSEGNIDTYTITFSDGTSSTFNITNGVDGQTPSITIGTNGNWFINNIDTGKSAKGERGDKGDDGRSILTVIKTSSYGLVDTYTITYSDGTTSTFTVTNGKDGKDGSSVLTGNGIPASTLGNNGDSYIDVDTWDYYIKEDDEWVLSGNISYKEKYVVNFYVEGELYDTQEVAPNSKLNEPEVPTKYGYDFSYWYVEGYQDIPWVFDGYYATRVLESVNLYAAFTSTQYTITYNMNGGTNNTKNPATYTIESNDICFLEPTKQNFNFDGWTDEDGIPIHKIKKGSTGNIVINANWTTTYKLDPKNGNIDVTSINLVAGQPYSLPTPTIKEKFDNNELIFDSWYIGGTRIPQSGDSWTYTNLGDTLIAAYTMSDANIEKYYRLILNDGTYRVYKCQTWCSEMFIPSSYKGVPVTTIGTCLFQNNGNITSIDIPNSVTQIESLAFMCCTGFTSINIPNSVTTIEDSAFDGCDNARYIIIPKSVTTINNSAFKTSMAATYICEAEEKPEGWNQSWHNAKFSETLLWGSKFVEDNNSIGYVINNGEASVLKTPTNISGNIEIPSTIDKYPVTKLLNDSFKNRSLIEKVILSDTLESIGYNAFSYCSSLSSINIPNSVTNIGDAAFGYCHSLSTIFIPESVTKMGYQAFFCCDSLDTIYCKAESQPKGWDPSWNFKGGKNVVWGYTPE